MVFNFSARHFFGTALLSCLISTTSRAEIHCVSVPFLDNPPLIQCIYIPRGATHTPSLEKEFKASTRDVLRTSYAQGNTVGSEGLEKTSKIDHHTIRVTTYYRNSGNGPIFQRPTRTLGRTDDLSEFNGKWAGPGKPLFGRAVGENTLLYRSFGQVPIKPLNEALTNGDVSGESSLLTHQQWQEYSSAAADRLLDPVAFEKSVKRKLGISGNTHLFTRQQLQEYNQALRERLLDASAIYLMQRFGPKKETPQQAIVETQYERRVKQLDGTYRWEKSPLPAYYLRLGFKYKKDADVHADPVFAGNRTAILGTENDALERTSLLKLAGALNLPIGDPPDYPKIQAILDEKLAETPISTLASWEETSRNQAKRAKWAERAKQIEGSVPAEQLRLFERCIHDQLDETRAQNPGLR